MFKHRLNLKFSINDLISSFLNEIDAWNLFKNNLTISRRLHIKEKIEVIIPDWTKSNIKRKFFFHSYFIFETLTLFGPFLS